MPSTIDTSSYPTTPTNPLAGISNTVGVAQGLTAQNLLRQQVQGRQNMAQLYAAAPIDQYGNPDPNYLLQNAGAAGIMAPQVVQDALSNKSQNLSIQRQLLAMDQDQLALSKNINDTVASSALPLVSDIQAAKNGTGPLTTNGQWDSDKAIKALASSKADVIAASTGPDGKPTYTPQQAIMDLQAVDSSNPDAMSQYIVGKASQAKAALGHINEALDIKRGTLGTADVGGMTQPTTQNIVTGQIAPAGQAVPTGTAVSANTFKPIFNTQAVTPNNPFSPTNPNNPNNPSGQPPQNIVGGKPSVPGSSNTAVQAGSVSNRMPAQSAPESTVPAAPPGYQGNLSSALDRANGAIDHANAAISLAAPLKGVLALADSGGPNSELAAKFKGAITDTPLGGLMDPTKDNVAKFEILSKFASDVTGQNMSTNARNQIESAVQGLSNPNSAQFPLALRTVSKYLLARADAAKAYGNVMSPIVADQAVTPAKVINAETDWRNNYDQNSFELPYMNGDEKKNLMGSMAPKDQQQFLSKTKHMIDMGLISPDDIQ